MTNSLLAFDAATALRMLGFVYALMAAAMLVLFKRLGLGRGSLAWSLGILSAALGAFLFSARGLAPDWATVYLANLLDFAAYGLAVTAVRAEVGLPLQRTRTTLAVLLAWAAMFAAAQHSMALRSGLGTAFHFVGALALSFTTWQAARATPMRGVLLIGAAYASYALSLLLLALDRFNLRAVAPDNPQGVTLALYAVVLSSSAACVYGTLGYIGMAMERLRRNEVAQAAALAREGTQRAAAEAHSRQLQHWLDERDRLIGVLAHEVRQPLNQASEALQGARGALALAMPAAEERRAQPPAVEHRVQRAQTVLGQVMGSLDNALAATALLASHDDVARHDMDLELLVQLVLGDLDASQSHRVRLERLSRTPTASMDAGLMRLALRNLLGNALAYSAADTPVVLRVSDEGEESDDPLALVFEVIDSGPGIDPELSPRLFQRGARGHHNQPGHGLGLYVVLRVAELHGSRVEMRHREGGGSIFRFILVQGRP